MSRHVPGVRPADRRPAARSSAAPLRGVVAAPASGERGAVTAELATALPLLAGVTLGLAWLLAVGIAKVQVVDAAREAARAAARGDSAAAAVVAAERVAPPGSTVDVSVDQEEVTATVVDAMAGPGGLFRFLPRVTVRADAVTRAEPEE
jgi:hypothetical protein